MTPPRDKAGVERMIRSMANFLGMSANVVGQPLAEGSPGPNLLAVGDKEVPRLDPNGVSEGSWYCVLATNAAAAELEQWAANKTETLRLEAEGRGDTYFATDKDGNKITPTADTVPFPSKRPSQGAAS